MTLPVAHYPTGASKWNPIEHRLFSQISRTWAGRPLATYETVCKTIRATRTTTGLQCRVALDRHDYPTGVEPTAEEWARLRLRRPKTLSAWNYVLTPNRRSAGQVISLQPLSTRGVHAPLFLYGGMNGDTFEAYVEQFLGPELRPGDVVVWDNLGAHRRARLKQLLADRGARLLRLAPYSPDFSPIELCWSKVKTLLRGLRPRTYDALLKAVVTALRAVTPSDARGWFRHDGYCVKL